MTANKNQLINNLAQKYNEKLQTVDSRIEELKAANQGLVSKATNAMTGVINTINKLKEMLLSVLSKAAGVIGNIIQDPIGFLGNLISGIKQGFENFAGNITNHLQSGLIGWLTGTLGPMGIQLPDDIFSLPGIFSLTAQVLGLTFNHIRGKAVKRFGEPVVAGMEQSVEVFQVLRDRGAMGLWEQVQEQFSDLKETVIGEIKNMVVTQVITAGVKWIIGLLNPASAFVKAAMAIYDIIMFFVNRGSQVLELVNSIVDAVAAIASGAVGGAAKLVENALSRALPVVIGFMASLLGVGGLAKKVEKIIGRIRQRIDKAIDKILLKAKKLFKGKKGKGNKEEKEIEVPKAISISNSAKIDNPKESLLQEIAKAQSGKVIYQASIREPKAATKKLLKEHSNAKLNKNTGTLALPSIKDAPLEAAGSLNELGAAVAQQTGLTQIILEKNQTGWSLSGKINPTIAALATYEGVPTSLEALIQEIKTSEGNINPSKEFFMSICREAANRHRAKIKFEKKFDKSEKPYREYTEVTFEAASGEQFTAEIVSVSDNICPACNTEPGVTRPHNVIPASTWKKVIKNALGHYSVPINLSDKFIAQILATGTSTKGPATTEDKQCRKCEDNQDKVPGPYSLLQRRAGHRAGHATSISHPSVTGVSGGDLFTGLQFQNANSAQLEQFTEDIVDRVIDKIIQVLNRLPTGHVLHSQITNDASKKDAFLDKIRTDALNAAKASPSAYPS